MAATSGRYAGQQAARIQHFEAAPRTALGEDADQLVADPLGRNPQDIGMPAADGLECGGVDRKIEAGGEADGAEHAQVVLAEPLVGVADGADHAALQILASFDEVQNLAAVRVHHEAVDREIAALNVLARIALEMDQRGTAAVGVVVVAAEGGDLHLGEDIAHQDHPEVGTDRPERGNRSMMRSGRASVATSKSSGLRPSSRSRTQPPTR